MAIAWTVILILAGCAMTGLGAYAWRQRTVTGAQSFSLLMFAIATWCLGYGIELACQNLWAKMLWIRVEYVGIAFIPALWVAFSLQYTRRGHWLTRRSILFLITIPALTIVLVWSTGLHDAVYRQTLIEAQGGWPVLHLEYGPWFWANTAYAYVCLLVGTLLLAQAVVLSPTLYRRHASALLIGAVIPWVSNFFYLTRIWPWPYLDPTPLAFALSALVLAYGLFYYGLLQVVPVARRTVVEQMPAAMIVLDAEDCIADLNPAARHLLDLHGPNVIGQPLRQAMIPAEIVDRFADTTHLDTELTWGRGDNQRVYQLTVSALDAPQAAKPPRLILVTNITTQHRAQQELEQSNQQLLALQESTAGLTARRDPASLFDRVIDQLDRLMPYQYAVLGLYEQDAARLTYVASRGFTPTELAAAQNTAMDRHPGWVVRHKRPLVVGDARTDSRVRYDGERTSRSAVTVPILLQERCLGILALSTPEPHAYTVTDRDLLLAFARQTAVAIDNARLYREIHRGAERLQVLHEAATLATTGDSLNDMLQHTVRLIKRTIASDNVALLLHEPESGDLVIRAWVGFGGKPKLMRRRPGIGIPGWVFETGEAALVPDVSKDSRYHSCDQDALSELCVPLGLGTRTIGALNLESQRLDAFSHEDLLLLTTLAEHLAVTLENARLGEQARDRAAVLAEHNRHLSLLHEIARVAASTLDLPTLYQKLADTLAQIIGGNGCYITHLDQDSDQVLGGAASGVARDAYPNMQPPPGERTLTESVLELGQALPIEDVHNSEYISPRIAEMFPTVSQLGLPLRVGERSLGAVLIAFDQPHTFTEDEISRASQAVDLAALALENARLFQSVQQSQLDWEALSLELQAALDNVKTLRGLVPICSSCKRIRDDSGYWQGVDEYVRDHSEARFSHGMCPECLRELYPWFERDDG